MDLRGKKQKMDRGQAGEQMNEQIKLAQQVKLLENIAKQKMSREAVVRYGSIKMAHPAVAVKAIALIAQAVQLGQITEVLDDQSFKNILGQIHEDKKQFNIKK